MMSLAENPWEEKGRGVIGGKKNGEGAVPLWPRPTKEDNTSPKQEKVKKKPKIKAIPEAHEGSLGWLCF